MSNHQSNSTIEVNLGSLLAKAVNTKAKTVEKKEMQIWKKFLILSAGFLSIGFGILYSHESIISTVGFTFIVVGIICLCVPTTYFLKRAYQKLGILKLIVIAFACYYSGVIIACNGKVGMILLIWAICLPYLAKRKPLRFF